MLQATEPVKRPGINWLDGLNCAGKGIGFILLTPRVWPYALVPAAVAFGLLIGLTFLGVWGSVWASAALFGEANGFWARLGSWLLILTLTLVSFVVAGLLALCLAQPLSGFALDRIVFAQERALTGRSSPEPGYVESLLRTVRISAVTIACGTPLLVILFAITFFFPAAAVVTVPLKFLVCAWLLAWDFLDYPLGIRRLGLRARLRWVGRRFGAFSAFGIAWAALLAVPGLVLLLLPMGVAGATQLVVEDEQLASASGFSAPVPPSG
jgi:CysZ protein